MRRLGNSIAIFGVLFALLPLLAVAFVGENHWRFPPSLIRAAWFTILQMALSTCVTIAIAVPLARALFFARFPGRDALIVLLGVPFILPVIVAVFGLTQAYGDSGVLNRFLASLSLPGYSFYGLQGIVVAHVFFNLPLAVRMLLIGWASIPEEQLRLTASLRAPVFNLIERPMLSRRLPGIAALVAMLCLTSFAIALIFGGGPRSTTLEVAIFQAIRYQFDLGQASMLALVQTALGIIIMLLAFRTFLKPLPVYGIAKTPEQPLLRRALWQRIADGLLIAICTVFIGLPVVMVLWDGLSNLLDLPSGLAMATLRSVGLSLVVTALCVILGILLLSAAKPLQAIITALPLTVSQIVLGTGMFILLRNIVNPFASPFLLVVPLLAFLGLPYMVQMLTVREQQIMSNYRPLCDSLRIHGFARLRIVVLPMISRELGYAAGLVAALSMGELGAIALFGTPKDATLPLLLYQLIGSYQMNAAAVVALVLALTSVLLFFLFERLGRFYAHDR